jgi:peptidoglycan hydrolase-like protein with peptidoglycan-binding domain
MNNIKSDRKNVSKPMGALAALSLAIGVGWTLSSGLKEAPRDVFSSSTNVQLASPYRGFCRQMHVFEGDREIGLTSQDVRHGLARISFQLEPGEHQVRLVFRSLIPGLDRDYPLNVTVDREPPTLNANFLDAPDGKRSLVTTAESTKLVGRIESGASLFLEGEPIVAQDDGSFEHDVQLKPGWNYLLLSARDAAGNQATSAHSVFRDVDEPELKWETRPDQVFDQKKARLELKISDDGKVAGVSGKVDGQHPIEWFAKDDGLWVGLTPELHEGFHRISVKAVDASGRVIAGERQVIIDSSEALGEAALGLGARGEDVKLLHQRLVEAGYLNEASVESVFGQATEKALKKLQEAEGFEVTGRAEGKTLVALGPRIFINLSTFSLVLDRPGKEQRRWMIASGSYEHPTPVGEFIILEKVYEPTWLPPKSDWAKDAKPIPPGPGNPLGTRWLGFDWGGVGIHGTNAPWSVGTASSHGCMRMVTGQVEELFELVEVGTPVVVLGGWEKDPLLERYWPEKKDEEETQTASAVPPDGSTAKPPGDVAKI